MTKHDYAVHCANLGLSYDDYVACCGPDCELDSVSYSICNFVL